MPEFYVESMKDRRTCFQCKLTRKGRLLTCYNCHAITYCGEECARADWERHNWNCVPVMVKEFAGKGRGIVAATDIKMGERIFKDKPVINLTLDAQGVPVDPDFMVSLKKQIENLPAEAKLQFYKLTTRTRANTYHVTKSDFEVLKLFLDNCKTLTLRDAEESAMLHLNAALVNHSCVPNAALGDIGLRGKDGDQDHELIAIKDISKGEEITICYYHDMKLFGSIPKKRKTAMKRYMGFECKCPVCLGQVLSQEKILKKVIELHKKLDPYVDTLTDWKREAGICYKIVDLVMGLLIGGTNEKMVALTKSAITAHLAHDKDLVTKVIAKYEKFVEEIKMDHIQRCFKILQRRLSQWSTEFNSGKAPEMEE